MSRLILDIETCGLPDAAEFAEPVSAPSNYKDEAKIAAYIAEKQAEQITRAGLDLDLCRVVAVGMSDGSDRVRVLTALDETTERQLLMDVWAGIDSETTIVGFNVCGFDIPVLTRRSQYLGVKHRRLTVDRYRTPHIDLMQFLTWNGLVRARSLKFYARRFGLDVDDEIDGKDVPALIAAGDYDAVVRHVTSDVRLTAALAQRVGLFNALKQATA